METGPEIKVQERKNVEEARELSTVVQMHPTRTINAYNTIPHR